MNPATLLLALLHLAITTGIGEAARPGRASDVYTLPSPVVGVPLEQVRVWAWQEGEWAIIPFQFDRRTDDGDWDFAAHGGSEAEHRTLSQRDELVVATADLGERAPPGDMPPGSTGAVPVGEAGIGFGYVANHDHPPPRSPYRWVTYDPGLHQVRLREYVLGFDPQRPFVLNHLVWSRDPHKRDWIDTGKIRARGRVMGAMVFRRTQEDFNCRLAGVIEGPVRLIVRTESRIRMVLGIQSPRSRVDRVHTPDTFAMEVALHLPFNVGWLFRDLVVRSSIDLNPGGHRTISCPGHPTAMIDGTTEPEEEALLGCPLRGFTIVGREGEVTGNMALGPRLDLQTDLYYRDDDDTPDPPESHPGQHGESGVILTGWEKLGRGDYRMRMVLTFRAATAPGGREP